MRTVIDSLEDEIFGAEMADEEGRVKPLAAANYLVRNPGAFLKIPWMIRNLALANALARRRYRSAYQSAAAVVLLTLPERSES